MSGANTKVWTDINREEHDAIIQNLRSKRWIGPAGDTGFMRGSGGTGKGNGNAKGKNASTDLVADWDYDEKESTLSMRIRTLPRGESYPSIFGVVDDLVRKIDR